DVPAAVIGFTFCIYSIEKAFAETLNRFPDAGVLNDINANADNHGPCMLQVKRVSGITLLRAELLDRIPGVVHAFSTRRAEHAQFTLGPTSNPMVQLNRSQFVAAAGAAGWPILRLNQTHSSEVCEMPDTAAANVPMTGDAAIATVRGALAAVQTADC